MNDQLLQRVRDCPNLPSLPAIAIQLLDLAKKPDVDIAEIARIISKDPALSCKILKTVNSTFYGRSQHVGTISHALVIMGLESVKTLMLGFSLVSHFTRSKSHGFKHLTYWRHSIIAATAARSIAAKANLVQQEEVFLAALLMDIGMLVLDLAMGDTYGEVTAKVISHDELLALEQATIEGTHAEVGGALAEQWKLPPVLAIPILHHHNPNAVTDPALKKLTQVVATGSRCADVFVDDNASPAIADARRQIGELCQLSDADSDAMLQEIGNRTKEMASLFEINIGTVADYESILKRANEALVEITLQSQLQTNQLQKQNVHLKRAATTDALTLLANRAHFDQFMIEQFSIAKTKNTCLSLLLMDIDKFKFINDTHGHPAGDQVLRILGKLLKSTARAQDLAARYGGEEMCLVLPATPKIVAATIAQNIRQAIAAQPILVGAKYIPVTASIGVACFEPGGGFRDVSYLLKAADLAVYAAKKAGRNCVRIFSLPLAA